jgi:hypothetical protein
VPHHGKVGLNRGAMLTLRTGHNSRWGAPSQWHAAPAPDLIVIDTLDKLAAHGHGVGGYRRDCRRPFSVSMPALIRERSAESPVVGMTPLPCPGCGGISPT